MRWSCLVRAKAGAGDEPQLAGGLRSRHLGRVKTASVQQVPQRWAEILDWVAAGEEVEVTQQEKVIARLVPATREPVARPDFLARAKSVWGERPAGEPLSALVGAARGGRP